MTKSPHKHEPTMTDKREQFIQRHSESALHCCRELLQELLADRRELQARLVGDLTKATFEALEKSSEGADRQRIAALETALLGVASWMERLHDECHRWESELVGRHLPPELISLATELKQIRRLLPSGTEVKSE